MIMAFCTILLIMSVAFLSLDLFIPPVIYIQMNMLFFGLKIIGFGFFFIGLFVLAGRIQQTGVGPFVDLPNSKKVILLHQRKGRNPNTSILIGKLTDLEFIRVKNKIFKDTGGGFRIAGHDVRRTHEMIDHDIPEWLSQYFYNIKEKYGITQSDQFKELATQLKQLKKPIPSVMTLEDQLNKIDLLNPIMQNDKQKQVLLNMDLYQLHHMEELLYDGITHHAEEVDEFIESATPNELDTLEKQTFLNDLSRDRNYRDTMQVDWGKYVIPMIFLFIGAALAFTILKGAM